MTTQPKRALLIGLDGANFAAMQPFLDQGLLPHLGRLLREGVRCANAYPPYPTLTGSNWATIATGAWPGTHGVTDMAYHVTGEPVDSWHSGFTSDGVEAETLWEAAARAGKRAITLKYTGSWPPRRPDLTMVDGGGGRPFRGGSFLELGSAQLYTTDRLPEANQIALEPARGWANAPASALPPLQARIPYRPETGYIPEKLRAGREQIRSGAPLDLWALICAGGSAGYDTLLLCAGRDAARPLAVLRQGDLSDSIVQTFDMGGRPQRGACIAALAHLDADSGAFDLYFSQLYPVDGFTQPAELGAELVDRFGAYFDLPPYSEEALGWFRHGPEIYLRFTEYQNDWLGRAGRYLMETRPWDFFAMQCHCIDYANHNFVAHHDWPTARREAGLRHLARCYQSVDRMVGELLAGAGDDALVCVVSDHGATENTYPEPKVNAILAEAGLLFYDEAGGHGRIDRARTLAETQRNGYIYISLQGRDPGGLVPPAEYEAVRDRVLNALTAYREPATGRNPFSLLLRKEDARILGLYDHLGRDIGDIVYALRPGYEFEHGKLLPESTVNGHSVKSLLIWRGPGIKAGATLQRTVWLTDVAPTIAHVMGWPAPSEAEGGVVTQALADHTTQFPRPDFMRRQEEARAAFRERVAEPAKPAAHIPSFPLDVQAPPAEESLPQTTPELQEALRAARAEAARWKNAYEQHRHILHED